MARRKSDKELARAVGELASCKDPKQRVALARVIGEAAADLERSTVTDAREAGLTWTQIGVIYGISKQAAQQRFRRTAPDKK